MSSGHSHAHNLSPAELDDLLDEALANPKIKQRLARPYKVLSGFDVAYLGSSSIGGAHVYLDRHLRIGNGPFGIIEVKGKRLNVVPGLIRHERIEQALEDILGWPYLKLAHPVAQHWEERDYIHKGFDPKDVEKAFQPYIKADELERLQKVPTDLDMRPKLAFHDIKVIEHQKATAQKEKRTHASVGYVEKSQRPSQRCGKCAMFIEVKYGGPGCTGVRSPIAEGGWCRRFRLGRLDDLVSGESTGTQGSP